MQRTLTAPTLALRTAQIPVPSIRILLQSIDAGETSAFLSVPSQRVAYQKNEQMNCHGQ